jgi:hypothetical protein
VGGLPLPGHPRARRDGGDPPRHPAHGPPVGGRILAFSGA